MPLVVLLLGAVLWTGCARNKTPPPPMMQPGSFHILNPMPFDSTAERTMVHFRGFFRHQFIPWSADLTLAAGLLEAEYTGPSTPFEITLIRRGQIHRINANRLLRGQDNPLLEPGDVIEIRR